MKPHPVAPLAPLALAAALVLALAAGLFSSTAPAGARPNAGSRETALPGAEPWSPPVADTVRMWGAEARELLVQSTADTIGARELRAFNLLGTIAQRYFERLGSRRMKGAAGVLTVFDTLKIEAEFAQDPELPQFCALTFFNPKFPGYAALTYLFWWRGEELKWQTVRLFGARRLQLEVWWTGNPLGPYEMGLIDYQRSGDSRKAYFGLLRLSKNADFWGVIQWGKDSIDFPGRGIARFVDLNEDAFPEVVYWGESDPDPRFVRNPYLPPILTERLWERSDSGFVLLDRRAVASPFATFVLFLRALERNQAAVVRDLSATAAIAQRAQALRLGSYVAPDSWRAVEYTDGGRWNQRMRFEYGQPPKLDRRLEVEMRFVDGRWVVQRLDTPGAPAAPAPKPAAPKGGGTKP